MTTTSSERSDAERLWVDAAMEDERAIVALLAPAFYAREAKNEATRDDEKLSPRIKQWLGLNPDRDELVDGEAGVRAFLQRRGETSWDLRPLDDAAVLALARAGLLTVQTKAFDALRKAAPSTTWDAIQNHVGVRLEGETWSLQVKRIE